MSSETKKPTIEELERILANNEQADIRVAPDGSVFVSREIDRLTTENQSLRTQLAEKEAEAAVMREALQLAKEVTSNGFLPNSHTNRFDGTHFDVHATIDLALSTSAGKSLLAQMEESERRVKQLEGFKIESAVILDERDQLKTELIMVGEDRDCARIERDTLRARLEEAVRLLSEISPAAFASTSNPSNWLKRRDTLIEKLKGGK